jgi:hypothetical protein
MNRLNSEGHDESQYLPKGIPPVNAFRAQHNGIKWEGQAIRSLTWLPDILNATLDENGKELLNRDHIATCTRFYSAVVSTRKTLGISDIRGYIADSKGEKNDNPSDIFFSVVNGLLPYQSNLCLWVVCDEYNRGNFKLAQKMIQSIQQSLDNAQKIIDEISKCVIIEKVPAQPVSLEFAMPSLS